MNIGVLSGKGGTGKTTIATNLALAMNANYFDCDVEEPNGFIFLNPEDIKSKEVKVEYPFVDDNKCINCGRCVKVCQFNALAKVKEDIVLFNKLCHSCGACELACENNAITYKKRTIGVIEEGKHKDIICKRGLLNIGEPMAVPIIKELLNSAKEGSNIIDCAPGTSCNVVHSIEKFHAAVLVTEPTKFGLHDLDMAVKLVRMFNIPFGVIINKYIEDENNITEYCRKENINVLGKVPYKKEAAEAYSKGRLLIEIPEYNEAFNEIKDKVEEVLMWN